MCLHLKERTDKNLCRCFGAPACRFFPDHLMTSKLKSRPVLSAPPVVIR